MASLRELIRVGILKVLSDGKARTARELVGILRMHLGRSDIEKHEINSVLYRDLADRVACDSAFNWQFRKESKTTEGIEAQDEKDDRDFSQKSVLLRTVSRLRSGLPPCENLQVLTAGDERILPVLREILAPRFGNSHSWGIVRGDYGAGKSHALALFHEMARFDGYGVCHISSDGLNNALNHPQRFLPGLFSTLEIPLRKSYGYTDILHDVLSDLHLTTRLKELTTAYLVGWSSMAVESRGFVQRVATLLATGKSHSDEWRECVRIATMHLTGETLRHLPASPANRQNAYLLLGLARDLVVELGMKGLAITIDEVESIYTKLPTIRSRQGAVRVLAALCSFPHGRVLLALTPDAYSELVVDPKLSLYDSPQVLPSENISSWLSSLNSDSAPVLDCKALDSQDRGCLLGKIADIYPQVYGSEVFTQEFKERWAAYVNKSQGSPVATRILVRQAIDIMDSFRYRNRT
jgi:hypothetical protein